MRNFILFLIVVFTANSFATDTRISAVKSSAMVKAIQKGLKVEQKLTCDYAIDENGDITIQFYVEDNFSKFLALLVCDNGQSALIKGKIGDGGQTAVESFQMVWAH